MNAASTKWIAVVACLAAAVWPAAGQETEGVAVTVYNGGFAVVREVRSLDIAAGGRVQFQDVAREIDATTVHFKSLTDPAAKLLEQNYQYDLVSADKLLQKYIDMPIEVVCGETTYSGTLLSFDAQQLVLQRQEGLAMVQRPENVRDIRFKDLPEGLITKPTLVWLVHTEKPGRHLAEVAYQTGGMTWHAEYVLVLNPDDTAGDLSGWVSVENNSGKTYRDARLKFIAGDVRKIIERRVLYREELARAAPAEAAPMAEKAFFEYHMYTLPRPSTVADNEVKQLEMFAPAAGVKIEKRFLYNPMGNFRWHPGGRYTDRSYGVESPKKVNIFIEFKNSEENKLGIPLPAGKVRVYKQDPEDKALEFIGEEQIDHTPKDEELSLQIGNAFDIVGERRQTEFNIDVNRGWMKESIEIVLRNHKKEVVTVRIKEPLYRWNTWNITAASHEYTKLDAFNVAWDVQVPPDGETKVTYTVEYTW
ncbi:MAG: DUF4139 domain-containing protein [Phycisphaerae bacterium]|nr:DUF4139 domain-containing protein [Phycisphaerae bacterium]